MVASALGYTAALLGFVSVGGISALLTFWDRAR